MPRAFLAVMMILALAPKPASADTARQLGANAALKYWRAFAVMPKLSDSEQGKLNAECLTMLLDARATDIVTRSEYALRLMYQGAALPRAVWAIDWEEEGIEALLPYLSAARALSSVACLRARMRFEDGHKQDAINDIFATMTLSRHIAADGTLLSILVGYAIDGRMGEALALYLPTLDAETIRGVKSRLAALPPPPTPAFAVRMAEERSLAWLIRKIKQAKDREDLVTLLKSFFLSDGKDDEARAKARSFLEECGGTAEGLIRFTEQARPSYAVMAKKLELPLDQFATEFDREQKRQSGNPVFRLFFPALAKVRWSQARAEVRRGLLEAALDIQLEGRGALNKHLDPVGGGPFEYTAFGGGFELRSNLKPSELLRTKWKLDERTNKPLVLTVGKRGK